MHAGRATAACRRKIPIAAGVAQSPAQTVPCAALDCDALGVFMPLPRPKPRPAIGLQVPGLLGTGVSCRIHQHRILKTWFETSGAPVIVWVRGGAGIETSHVLGGQWWLEEPGEPSICSI